MKKSLILSAIGLAAAAGAQAQEVGRVISTTPVIQQVAVPRQVCTQQQVVVEQPKSGAGAALGAIAGGAVGSQIGGGSGRAAATVLGVMGGLMLGERVEGGNQQVQNQQTCTTQTFYENRTASYNVVYEFNGKQYSVNLPHDPGPTVRLQITPVSSGPVETLPAPAFSGTPAPMVTAPAPVITAPAPVITTPAPVVTTPIVTAPIVTAPVIVPNTVVYPATYYAPYYAPRPYYRPPVSLHFGYVWHGGHHHHRRWR
jgi:uncharacterized protein YcfJ